MNLNVVLPLCSSVLSFVFFVLLVDQWRTRRKAHQAAWAIGMLWYGISAGTEFVGSAFGWSEPLYRVWYLVGAVWVAAWLGLGTVYLLGRTRFGFAFALSLLLAGLFTYLTQARYSYADSGIAPILYAGIAAVLAVVIAVMTYREDHRWADVAGWAVVIGSAVSAVMAFTAPLPAPGWIVNPATHIPTGDLFPGYLRLLTPFFNVTGAFALSLGAVFSAYVFMPKRRFIHYTLNRHQPAAVFAINLLIAIIAIPLNFLISLPGAVVALFRGQLNSRVPATILIAIGGIVPAITSGLNRFGDTSGFFVGELAGVVFLFLGFLASIEVFREFRIPFTNRVLRARPSE